MKLTKILSVSAILLAGLMLTGCQKEPGSGGTSGNNPENNPTGIKAEDVIKVSEDGKTVEINYTNNTDEEQKFLLFAGETFGYNISGRFYVYNPEGDTKYKFGMFYDYCLNKEDCLCFIAELESMEKENSKPKIQTTFTSGELLITKFNNLYFDDIISYHGVKGNPGILTINEQGFDKSVFFNLTVDSDNLKADGNYFNKLKNIVIQTDISKKEYGFYLQIQAGSTCKLKFELKNTTINW